MGGAFFVHHEKEAYHPEQNRWAPVSPLYAIGGQQPAPRLFQEAY